MFDEKILKKIQHFKQIVITKNKNAKFTTYSGNLPESMHPEVATFYKICNPAGTPALGYISDLYSLKQAIKNTIKESKYFQGLWKPGMLAIGDSGYGDIFVVQGNKVSLLSHDGKKIVKMKPSNFLDFLIKMASM